MDGAAMRRNEFAVFQERDVIEKREENQNQNEEENEEKNENEVKRC